MRVIAQVLGMVQWCAAVHVYLVPQHWTWWVLSVSLYINAAAYGRR